MRRMDELFVPINCCNSRNTLRRQLQVSQRKALNCYTPVHGCNRCVVTVHQIHMQNQYERRIVQSQLNAHTNAFNYRKPRIA